jgi:hypothetical protein
MVINFKITSCFNVCFNDSILYFFLLTQRYFFLFSLQVFTIMCPRIKKRINFSPPRNIHSSCNNGHLGSHGIVLNGFFDTLRLFNFVRFNNNFTNTV